MPGAAKPCFAEFFGASSWREGPGFAAASRKTRRVPAIGPAPPPERPAPPRPAGRRSETDGSDRAGELLPRRPRAAANIIPNVPPDGLPIWRSHAKPRPGREKMNTLLHGAIGIVRGASYRTAPLGEAVLGLFCDQRSAPRSSGSGVLRSLVRNGDVGLESREDPTGGSTLRASQGRSVAPPTPTNSPLTSS